MKPDFDGDCMMDKTNPGTEQIEDDIRTTRRNIDDKIERIQQRLSPGDVVDNVIDFAKTNGGALAGSVGRTVRDNPVPIAMIGAGIVWLALSTRSRYQAEAADEADTVDDNDNDSDTHTLRDRATALRDDVRDRAGKIGRQARIQALRAKKSSGRFVKDHPILVGAAGIALGAAVAASLPRSEREDRAFGEHSDRAKEAARSAAVKEGRKIQDAAKAAVTKAKEAAEKKASEVAESVKDDAAQTAKASSGGRPSAAN
jgi:ElaB/YqjD/DUF883 family membrane-anchored ribosome-binding protein